MKWILSRLILILIFEFLINSEEKVIRQKDNKVEEATWLEDDENYDLPMDYLGDAFDTPQKDEKCPPLPEILTSSACMAKSCFSDNDCGESEGRCCDNGCVFTCLSYPIGPTYIDWVREPKRQQRNGISWLLKESTITEELDPCSTTRYMDEDPLLCPTGYICHVEKPANMKKDIPNLGHCIPEKDVVVQREDNSDTDIENVCYLEDYILADGARIKLEHQTCYCKQGFLTCLARGS